LKKHLIFWLLALSLLGCSSTGKSPATTFSPVPQQTTAPTGRLTFAGSTTMQPLVQKLGEAYNQTYPGVALEIAAGGSSVGIQAAQEGTADLGMASRQIKPEERKPGLEVHEIAWDVLAIIVHPSNPVQKLTLTQLTEIYQGKITNWREVGGKDLPIQPLARELTSGTRTTFDELVLHGQELTAKAEVKVTAGEVRATVATQPAAIGYVGFGHDNGDDLLILAIDEVWPTQKTVAEGKYKLKRPLSLLLGSLSHPLAQTFVAFALSVKGQELIAEDGWLALTNTEISSP